MTTPTDATHHDGAAPRQAAREAIQANTPLSVAEKALRAKDSPGITVQGWTLGWTGDQWTVGRLRAGKDRMRWSNPSWHGQLDHALRRLLERCVEGDVSELAEAVERVERCYLEIGSALMAAIQASDLAQ